MAWPEGLELDCPSRVFKLFGEVEHPTPIMGDVMEQLAERQTQPSTLRGTVK